MATVSVESMHSTPSKKKSQKPILTPQEIEAIKTQKAEEISEKKKRVEEYTQKWRELIEKGDYDKENCDQIISESWIFESAEVLDMTSKVGFNGYLETQMLKYHPNFDFESGIMLGEEEWNSSFELAKYFDDECPHLDEIYYYTKYVVLQSKMEKEIPLMALAYIERLLSKVGILMNHWNWRRIILVTLIVGSKVWDDDSLENVHFPKVMHDTSLKEVNGLEKMFLEFIDFDLAIKVKIISNKI